MLPRVVPAVPTGYTETEQDAENAWNELMTKFRGLILSSFDTRVSQYEEDIKERDAQRTLPGWNFCTFFILKEGLARGFENVGLVEDALVGYDELSIGLDAVLEEQAQTGQPERHGGAMLRFTKELQSVAQKALTVISGTDGEDEAVDLQSTNAPRDPLDDIPISSTKKLYREMILANKVSVFDFRCYIFSRQIALLLRLSNAVSSREELLAKLKDQQDAILYGVAPLAPPPPRQEEDAENLIRLAEICSRTLRFIPSISQIIRQDIIAALARESGNEQVRLDPALNETIENLVASFSFSVAQQILAQTASKALPIPPSSLSITDAGEPKASIPEPKTMMHPARHTSLNPRPQSMMVNRSTSPNTFPGGARRASVTEGDVQSSQFLKSGLEELAAKRAELHLLSRSILNGVGAKRNWTNGWVDAPMVGEPQIEMVEISLNDDDDQEPSRPTRIEPSMAGIESPLLRTAIENSSDYYRLYEILTDKALRHYTVANYDYAVKAAMADLAVLKLKMKEYRTAASFFYQATPFFGESGWTLLELSMLVMYTRCLSELDSDEDFVRVTLKLLTKACAAERERLQQRRTISLGENKKEYPDLSVMKGVGKLFELSSKLSTEAKVPLEHFFTNVELNGTPEYHDEKDSFSIRISLYSLLPEEVIFDSSSMRLASPDGQYGKEVWLKNQGNIKLAPGANTVVLDCQSFIAGNYVVDRLLFSSGKLLFHFERDANTTPPRDTDIFKKPKVTLFQRSNVLDVVLKAAKDTALDKNNSLDLVLTTGWNELKSCEITVKPATGGLRLLTMNATFVDSDREFTKSPETAVFSLGEVKRDSSVTIRFPYSMEQDVGGLLAKLEVAYVTESGETYTLAKTVSVPVSLALGVNVQDVFKHNVLFSRFSVSTSNSGPLRLYKSELLSSELFDAEFGVPPSQSIIVFPKQPATLMYKIRRKPGVKSGKRPSRTMYLKLYYNQLQGQIQKAIIDSALESLDKDLSQWSRVIEEVLSMEIQTWLQPQDVERAALLSEISLAHLQTIPWKQRFEGLGKADAVQLSTCIESWMNSHGKIALSSPPSGNPSSILIPVEIPSLSVVHTVDISLQNNTSTLIQGACPAVSTNQVISATLHLKWTRIWDTESSRDEDREYSYEVIGDSNTWLIGGRRKGHFVIPSCSSEDEVSSTPATEAEIPLILIPQKEGWLPYPSVEIREIGDDGQIRDYNCEMDWRNLGESIQVVGERKAITLSLDASGPGGGPLVLETEGIRGNIVV